MGNPLGNHKLPNSARNKRVFASQDINLRGLKKTMSQEEYEKEYVFRQLVEETIRETEVLTININRNNAVDRIIEKTCYTCNSV